MSVNVLKFSGAICIGSLAADPSNPQNGLIYYNTSDDKFRKYENGSWSDLVDSASLADLITLTGVAANSTDLGSFTGTTIPDGQTIKAAIQALETSVELKLDASEVGVSVATLVGGKVPVAQLPNAIMEYQGVWNASTNSPALADGAGNADTDIGNVYRVSVAGSQDLGSGSISFSVGDYVILNSSKVWEKADTTDAVSSVNGHVGAVTGLLENVVEDTTPQLGGALDLNGQNVEGNLHRAALSGTTSFVEEQYLHALTLTASQTSAVQSSLTFAFASFEGLEVTYKIKEATSNRVRIGTLRCATNGTDVTLTDTFTETGDVGVTWAGVINGSNVELQYTTTANNKTMRADVKRFKA